MANEKLITPLLMKTDLFGGLDKANVGACASAFHEVRFAKGEALFARGETGNACTSLRKAGCVWP